MKKTLTISLLTAVGLMLGCSDLFGPGSEDEIPHIVKWPVGSNLFFHGVDAAGSVTIAADQSTLSHDSTSLFLGTSGVPTAPLDTTSPTTSSLANYDPDRDSQPGLKLSKSALGIDAEQDTTKYQEWWVPGPYHLLGDGSFTIWSTLANSDDQGTAYFEVGLYDCDASRTSCQRFSTGSATRRSTDEGGNGWREQTIDFGDANKNIPVNRVLLLRIAVSDSSDTGMRFAYGTTGYPSKLTFQGVTSGNGPKKLDWSFFAVRGKQKTMNLTVLDAAGSGQDIPFMTFETAGPTVKSDGSVVADGDSIQITVTVDTTEMIVYFEPSGTQFDPTVTELKIWYGGVGGDLNGDGVVNQLDTEIENGRLNIWYQQDATQPWERLGSDQSTGQKWLRIKLKHFSNYAVAW